MNRDKFLSQLEALLTSLPESDRLDAIAYYNDYFDDAGIENEQNVIRELGSPEKVAETILGNPDTSYYEPQSENNLTKKYTNPQNDTASHTTPYTSTSEKKKTPWVLIIIILILTFPIWIGIVGGILGVLVGMLGAILGVICALFGSGLGLVVGGIVSFIAGLFRFAVNPLEAVVSIGVGAILIAIGLLLLLLCAWITFKWFPTLCKLIFNGCSSIFHRNKGGNAV